MKIVIKNYKLIALLKKVYGVVEKNTKNILSYILLKVIDNKLFCIAINDYIEIVTYDFIDENFGNIEIIIEYKLIYNISKKTNLNEDITIIKEKKYLEIIASNTFFKVSKSLTAFPSFEFNDNCIYKIKIESNLFLNILKHIKISAAENNPQRFLNGIFLNINNNIFAGMSADGFRVSYFNIINFDKSNNNIELIIPKITLNEIINNFDYDNIMFLMFFSNQIKFISNRITLTSKFINDIYHIPNIKIDLYNSIKLFLNTKEFKHAIEKIFIINSFDEKAVLTVVKDKIFIKSGCFNENVIIYFSNNDNYNNVEIAFNYKQFFDILKFISEEFFELIIVNNNTIFIIKERYSNVFHIVTSFNL